MSTPQQPQDPNRAYVPEGYELAKKKKPWYQRLGCIVPIAILAILIIVIAVNMGGSDNTSSSSSSNGSSSSSNGASAEDSGPATLGETISIGKADVTASNLRASSDAIGQYLCIDVAFVVTGDDPITLNGLMDWKLTDPNGVTATQTVGGETDYDSVEVGPGGNKSGVVCFDSAGAPGKYTITFEEGLSFNTDKAIWEATL